MVDRDFDKYIAEIYRDMEIQIIQSMKRNLARHTLEEEKYGFNYPQWQAMKIKELRRYQRENGRILQGVSNKIPKDVSKHIKEELIQGSLDEMKKYREAMADGYKSAVAMKDSFFKINERKVNSLIKAVKNDLKTANTAALRMTNDVYREVIFKVGMFSANGVMTSKQAIDMATKDFLTRGINCIEYKDGRRVNIADYTSMAVRTANQRAYMIGEGEFRKRLGETLVIISQHNTSCEKCKPFERKVLIDDVYSGGTAEDGDYMLLSQAMAAGLFHPRCRHGLGTYYPELEEINGYETTDNRLNEYGDEELNRAHIENMVQRYRRLLEGSLDPDNIAKYRAKLREWENRLDGLGNNEFNAKNEQKSVENTEKSSIINLEPVNGKNIVGEFEPREEFNSLIDDIIDYQGFNGKPAIAYSQAVFNKMVQEDHFLAERTIRADRKEILEKYLDQLLCQNGENYFHVNCNVGGAQYGQGMYCAADYSKGKMGLSMFQHEINQYGKMDNAGFYKTKWLTLEKTSKILRLPYGEKASEYISDLYIEAYVKKFSRAPSELVNKYFKLNSERYTVSNSEYEVLMRNLHELRKSIGEDVFKQARNSTMYKTNGSAYPRMKDPGVLAAEMGFDAINAEGHGATDSYTVILNRTKIIFFGGDVYAK